MLDVVLRIVSDLWIIFFVLGLPWVVFWKLVLVMAMN